MLESTRTAAPVGSIVFSVLALLTVSLAVLLVLRHYLPLRTTPAFYLTPIFFALWLPCILVLLVPIDLASSAVTDDLASRGIWLPQRVVLVSWRFTYWLTFFLTWFILPILAEYSDTGYREPRDRLLYSLRANGQYWAIVLSLGATGLVYVFVAYEFSLTALRALVMALSYCWGLMFAIYLMGHGLVAVPRNLLRGVSISGRLRRLQTKAPRAYEKMEDSMADLEEVEFQVFELGRRKGAGSAMAFRDWIEDLQDMANVPESRPHPHPPSASSAAAAAYRDGAAEGRVIPSVITEKYLAELTRKLVRARHAKSRFVTEWAHLVQEAADTQRILDSAASRRLQLGDISPHAGFWDRLTVLDPYTRYLYHYYAVPCLRVAFGACLALASACIVWSEIVRLPFPKLSVIRLSVIHHWVGDKAQVGFAGQAISAFWISYMCVAALSSISEVKVWRGRALVRRNTGYEAAFWYAGQVAKLSVPLSYNFLTFLTGEVYQKTTFYRFLGQYVDVTPLGRLFDDVFPFFLVVPVLAALFGLYGRIKRLFVNVDIIDDADPDADPDASSPRVHYGTGSWREGRDLIARELGQSSALRRDTLLGGAYSNNRNTWSAAGRDRRAAPPPPPPSSSSSLSAPALRDPAAPPRSATNTRRLGPARAAGPPPVQHDDDGEGFLQILGHRVKNTMDLLETPRWLQDIGQGIPRPRWMGRDDPGAAPDGAGGSDIRRWFGGNGHIRL
ncbi:LIMR family protein [Escovopsis weberi]|uniref:LIMR family protein n=1 Tax=Escovopsis weberi TaxID=150374 RepID=A0A0N0RT22_ESCWE|nr:LIMR family protein [Escovopsis weberi]